MARSTTGSTTFESINTPADTSVMPEAVCVGAQDALRRKGRMLVYDGDLAPGASWPSARELREEQIEELAERCRQGAEPRE